MLSQASKFGIWVESELSQSRKVMCWLLSWVRVESPGLSYESESRSARKIGVEHNPAPSCDKGETLAYPGLEQTETSLEQSRAESSYLKLRNEPWVKPNNDPEPKRAELRAKPANRFPADKRADKSGLSGSDEIWWRTTCSYCLSMLTYQKQHVGSQKNGQVDMLTFD